MYHFDWRWCYKENRLAIFESCCYLGMHDNADGWRLGDRYIGICNGGIIKNRRTNHPDIWVVE